MGGHSERIAGDQVAWTVALRLREFGYAGIAVNASIPLKRTTALVRQWVQEGRVEALGKQGTSALRFRVIGEGAPAPAPAPVSRTPEAAMWFTIRNVRNAFTPTDVAVLSSLEAAPVGREDATSFCQMLTRAGYLRVVRKAVPPRREAAYRLIRDTGPRPPRERRLRVVWDDNLDQITHLPEASA